MHFLLFYCVIMYSEHEKRASVKSPRITSNIIHRMPVVHIHWPFKNIYIYARYQMLTIPSRHDSQRLCLFVLWNIDESMVLLKHIIFCCCEKSTKFPDRKKKTWNKYKIRWKQLRLCAFSCSSLGWATIKKIFEDLWNEKMRI